MKIDGDLSLHNHDGIFYSIVRKTFQLFFFFWEQLKHSYANNSIVPKRRMVDNHVFEIQ